MKKAFYVLAAVMMMTFAAACNRGTETVESTENEAVTADTTQVDTVAEPVAVEVDSLQVIAE